MTEVLSQLPFLTWRGLAAPPCESVSFSWANDLAARAIPYVDVDVHDDVRRKSAEFKVRLFFCETVEPGAFTQKWPQWLDAIKTGTPDYLVHPLLGTIRARVAHVGGEVKARMRDGVVVEIDFIETNEDPSVISADITSQSDILVAAQAADAAASSFGVSWPSSPLGTSIFSAISGIRGSLFSFDFDSSASVTQIIGNISQMIDAVEAVDDHQRYAADDALLAVWRQLYQAQQLISARARRVLSRVVANDTTLDRFARETSNTLQDIMQANLFALRAPIVPKGTTLRYFAAA